MRICLHPISTAGETLVELAAVEYVISPLAVAGDDQIQVRAITPLSLLFSYTLHWRLTYMYAFSCHQVQYLSFPLLLSPLIHHLPPRSPLLLHEAVWLLAKSWMNLPQKRLLT